MFPPVPRVEALIKNLCHGLPRMGLFNDEGGQFLDCQHPEQREPIQCHYYPIVTLGWQHKHLYWFLTQHLKLITTPLGTTIGLQLN